MATSPKQPNSSGRIIASAKESQPRAQAKLTKSAKEDSKGDRAPAADAPPAAPPDENRIRERAHAIWIEEGRPHGRDVEHWIRARWELDQEKR